MLNLFISHPTTSPTPTTWMQLPHIKAAAPIVSTLELAKVLVHRDELLSVAILIMKLPFDSTIDTYVQSAASTSHERIRFVHLPRDDSTSQLTVSKSFYALFIEKQKPYVKETATQLVHRPSPPRLAGLLLDFFCTTMIDVANELSVPSYVFFTSGAAFLGLLFHIQAAFPDYDGVDVTDLDADTELRVSTLKNPVPVKLLPRIMLQKDVGSEHLNRHTRRLIETKGIMVNTFSELEPYAFNSFGSRDKAIPSIYPIGPILDLCKKDDTDHDIMTWPDKQPRSSVVFLCFGSMGSFGPEQLQEMARGLESSGHRFLWSIRRPPPKGKFEIPKDHENPEQVLPEGFLNRTAGIGKVIGWAPQKDILAHPAVGGFVSHCGWNSTLESLWFGIPMATWPMYAEQQFNALQLVKEMEIAVEIKIDYSRDPRLTNETQGIVSANEIETGIRQVMEEESEVRSTVMKLKEMSRKAVEEGGSSHKWLDRFIKAVTENTPMTEG